MNIRFGLGSDSKLVPQIVHEEPGYVGSSVSDLLPGDMQSICSIS